MAQKDCLRGGGVACYLSFDSYFQFPASPPPPGRLCFGRALQSGVVSKPAGFRDGVWVCGPKSPDR